jgi:hypothetical protein
MATKALPTPAVADNAPQSLGNAARARIALRIDYALAEADRLIARLDALDGDLDLEEVGAEDDFSPHRPGILRGPGCPIADPDSAVDDLPCDGDDDAEEEDYDVIDFSDPVLQRRHRDRIRRQKCERFNVRPYWFAGRIYSQAWRLRETAGAK